MRLFFLAAMVAALGAAGCSGDPCAELAGKSFESVAEYECGLGPNGPVPCNWRLSFSEGSDGGLTYSWDYSDVGSSGPVECKDGALSAEPAFSGQEPYTGTYDPDTETLVWDGIDYQLASQ